MFSIFVYFLVVYLLSAAIFGLELYAIERNEPPMVSELRVATNDDPATSELKVATEEDQENAVVEEPIAKRDVTRRKRKKLIRRLHKLSSH